MVNQKSTPVTKKLACCSQMWMDWLVSAVSKSSGHVPEHHDQVERHQCRPRVHDESTHGPQRARPAPEQEGPTGPAAHPDGKPVQQRHPRRPEHDEDRGEEGDQDVLDMCTKK